MGRHCGWAGSFIVDVPQQPSFLLHLTLPDSAYAADSNCSCPQLHTLLLFLRATYSTGRRLIRAKRFYNRPISRNIDPPPPTGPIKPSQSSITRASVITNTRPSFDDCSTDWLGSSCRYRSVRANSAGDIVLGRLWPSGDFCVSVQDI